jgi:hypothetical protein
VAGFAGSWFAKTKLPPGTVGPVYPVTVALLGFFGVDSIRWLVRVPMIVVRPLTEPRRLLVVMHSPATTPAVREMAQLAADVAVRVAPLLVSTGVVVYVTFVPQLWLSRIVLRQRDRLLDELADKLPEEGPAGLLDPNTEKVMALYDQIASVSTETAEARVIFRRLLAVSAVLLPQALAVALKLLHVG